MEGTGPVDIVKLETLDVGRVEEGGGHGGEFVTGAPADEGAGALRFHVQDRAGCCFAPGEVRADEGASDAIEDEVFGSSLHFWWDFGEFGCRDPVGELGSHASVFVRGGCVGLVLGRHVEVSVVELKWWMCRPCLMLVPWCATFWLLRTILVLP